MYSCFISRVLEAPHDTHIYILSSAFALLIHNKNIEAPHVITNLLANAAGPVPLVLDLRVAHDRVASSADPVLNGHLRYPRSVPS
jgi:hypothetical protein